MSMQHQNINANAASEYKLDNGTCPKYESTNLIVVKDGTGQQN